MLNAFKTTRKINWCGLTDKMIMNANDNKKLTGHWLKLKLNLIKLELLSVEICLNEEKKLSFLKFSL